MVTDQRMTAIAWIDVSSDMGKVVALWSVQRRVRPKARL